MTIFTTECHEKHRGGAPTPSVLNRLCAYTHYSVSARASKVDILGLRSPTTPKRSCRDGCLARKERALGVGPGTARSWSIGVTCCRSQGAGTKSRRLIYMHSFEKASESCFCWARAKMMWTKGVLDSFVAGLSLHQRLCLRVMTAGDLC